MLRQRIRPRTSNRRCPYCHDGIREGLFTHCDGCRSLYHAECADEMQTCGCGRALEAPREHELLPLTGRAIGRSSERRSLAIGAALVLVPLFLLVAAVAWGAGAYLPAVVFGFSAIVFAAHARNVS